MRPCSSWPLTPRLRAVSMPFKTAARKHVQLAIDQDTAYAQALTFEPVEGSYLKVFEGEVL